MSADWAEVWRRKAATHRSGNHTLAELMRLNGYDISCSTVGEPEIIRFVESIIQKLCLPSHGRILEIGCGAGALLKVFSDKGYAVAGVDFSDGLLKVAQDAIPNGDFIVSEANQFDLAGEKFDACFSHSVFHYFPSSAYAADVYEKMILSTKLGGGIAVTDVHDVKVQREHLSWRRQMLGDTEYERLYRDVTHQYFASDLFEEIAKSSCSRFWFERQLLPSPSSIFKFNAFAIR